MMKVKEKISGCFMSQKGGRIFMTIYAYILSVKKNGINIMQALLDAMNGNPFYTNWGVVHYGGLPAFTWYC